MPDIRPDRNNWKLFCEEPELTEAEAAEWQVMAKAIREAEAEGNEALFNFIFETAEPERKGLCQTEMRSQSEEDWSDLVAFVDAERRLKRAEIAAFERWQACGGEAGDEAADAHSWGES